MILSDKLGSQAAEPPWRRNSLPRLTKIGSLFRRLANLAVIAALLLMRPSPLLPRDNAGTAVAAQRVMLTGQLLVARDELQDPRFFHSVIYIIHHDEGGAMGLIVNRPIGEASVSDLLEQAGLEGTGVKGKIRVHFGGPVEPSQGFVLHTADYTIEGTEVVEDGIAVTATPEILRAIGTGTGPRRSLFALGYAGWAPGQLEAELKARAWEIIPADKTLLFDENAETKWERAMARRTIRL